MSGPADVGDGPATVRVGDRLADALVAAGLRELFGLLASSNMRIVDRLVSTHSLPFYNARHEAVALGMADGYARASGRPAFCAVTQGPGLLNSVTALVTAQRGRSPVVLLACDSARMDPRRYPFSAVVQGLDQPAVLDALGVGWLRLAEATVEACIAEAAERAVRERRPVVVLVPTELQHEPSTVATGASGRPEPVPEPPAPDPAAVAAAAEALRRARRPVVLAGIGAVSSGARAELVALAERTGAVLATSLRAAGWFSGVPFDAGICGGFSTPAAVALLGQADCVIAFGAGLNFLTTRKGSLFADATVIQVDDDPRAFGLFTGTDVTVLGDARRVAALLLESLQAATPPPGGLRTDANRRLLATATAGDAAGGEGGLDGIDPRALCRRLEDLLPAARTVVTDSGYSFLFPVEFLSVAGPDALLFMADFGAVGCGLGPALGAALGRPDRLAVLFIGDGGLVMTLGDLDTAVRYRIPLLVVCMNDQAYGAEIVQAREHGLDERLASFPTASLAGTARSIGLEARTVTRLADLDELPGLLRSLDGPLFLDCRTATVASRVHEWV